MAKSPVPFMYPLFLRNTRPKYRFTSEEIKAMLDKSHTHLLPEYNRNRTNKIAWVVSNNRPKNARIQYAKAINKFITVSS